MSEQTRRDALRAYVTELYPPAKTWRPGSGQPGYTVMSRVEPCEMCAVPVVVLQRHDRDKPAWYQVGGVSVYPGRGHSVRFERHTRVRCWSAKEMCSRHRPVSSAGDATEVPGGGRP